MFGLSVLGQTFILEERDKRLHFSAGSIAGAFGIRYVVSKVQKQTKAMITGFCTSLLAGVAKEVFDNARGGVLDKRDILATGMGGLFVTLQSQYFKRRINDSRNYRF